MDPNDTCKDYCANQKNEAFFNTRMTRGVWYDFIIQSKMSDRSDPTTTGYVYVRMKREDQQWDPDNDDDYDHMVYQYKGPVGWATGDDLTPRYYPFINIYRSQHDRPQNSSEHLRDNKHLIDVDEIRVGTDYSGPHSISAN